MKGLYLIPDRTNLEESLRLIKKYQANFEYNDFFMAAVLEDKQKQLEIIDTYAKVRSDFSKDTMHGAFLDVTVHSSDAKVREISELRVRQSLDIAKEMGLYGVVFHTNRLYGFRESVYLKNWIEINERFYKTICEEYPNQQIFMENMFDEAPDVLRELAERMADCPNFGICLDYAHAAISGTDASEWMKQLAPFVKHMHINDNDLRNDLHAPIGQGELNWKLFTSEIKKYQMDTTVLVEVTGVEKQRKALEYMAEHKIFPLQ